MYDLLITGGTVVTPRLNEPMDVAVQGEQIAAVQQPGSLGAEAKKVVDATECIVMPGGVDPHCHYNIAFGDVCAETQQYSPAAAFGGDTTIIDFVLQEPPASLADAVSSKKEQASGQMAVDYAFHAILTAEISFEVMEEIGDVIRAGIPTIKTMMTYGWMCDDGHRWGVMNEVAQHGGMSVVHAEDDAIANWLTKKYLREGKTHGAYIAETRGPLVEEAAIRRALLLAERSGSPLYVLHMAAGSGVEALAEARAKGLPFYGETLTPYLSFTAEALWDDEHQGLLWNNYPTIKHKEDQDVLWQAIADNRLQVVSSDHFLIKARDRYEKMGTTVDALQCGQAGVELRIPVLFHLGVNGGRISVNRFVELVSTNPAKIMGLYPEKGRLEPGADADITIFDPNRNWTVHHEDLHMSADYSCWEGWEIRGKVRTTILRGVPVVENEQFVGDRRGQFVPRKLLPEIIDRPPDFAATFEAEGAAVAV